MTVKELIKALERADQEAEVYLWKLTQDDVPYLRRVGYTYPVAKSIGGIQTDNNVVID